MLEGIEQIVEFVGVDLRLAAEEGVLQDLRGVGCSPAEVLPAEVVEGEAEVALTAPEAIAGFAKMKKAAGISLALSPSHFGPSNQQTRRQDQSV